MKTLNILIALISLFVIGNTTYADDRAAYALGGFILGQIINNRSGDIDVGVHSGHRGIDYDIRYRNYHNRSHRDYQGRPYDYSAPRGYWTTKRFQVWVPGRWICGHHGNRVWAEGYYEWVTERIWVETGRGRP